MENTILKVFLIIGGIISFGIGGGPSLPYPQEAAPLKVSLSSNPKTKFTPKTIPIVVALKNTGDETIKLLNMFDRPRAVPMFFYFQIKGEDGSLVQPYPAPLIEFAKADMKYAELKKGKVFDLLVNLADFVPAGSILRAGTYTVSVTYANQSGRDCFKGMIKSDHSLTIRVVE